MNKKDTVSYLRMRQDMHRFKRDNLIKEFDRVRQKPTTTEMEKIRAEQEKARLSQDIEAEFSIILELDAIIINIQER